LKDETNKRKKNRDSLINNLLLELIHYYMKSIGQSINKDEQMVNITLTELSKYIFKHHLSYTMQEIREAFTYGRNNDQTQGGAIYAQRMIFWLKNYHNEVWLKKIKQPFTTEHLTNLYPNLKE